MITAQMIKLRGQIRSRTLSTVSVPGTLLGGRTGDATLNVNLNTVSLGMAVLGLTWASVVAMALDICVWAWIFTKY